jgi:hypothetical protein
MEVMNAVKADNNDVGGRKFEMMYILHLVEV